MDTRYYKFPSLNYPSAILAMTYRMLVHVCEVLYKNEIAVTDIDTVMAKRLVKADIDSGSTISLGDAIEQLKTNRIGLPFTAYTIGGHEFFQDLWTYHGAAGLSSDYTYSEKVSVWPIQIPVLFFSFFDNPHDYFRALSILSKQIAITATRLEVPYFDKIKNETFVFYADVAIEIVPGEYPFKYESQKSQYEVWDLSHAYTVTMYDMYFDNENFYPIETASLYLKSSIDELLGTTITTTIPSILSSNINDGDTGVSLTQDITIEFSENMAPATLIYQVLPYQSITTSWNSDCTILTIHPYGDWNTGVEYSFTIFRTIESSYYMQMKEDYSINFTTV